MNPEPNAPKNCHQQNKTQRNLPYKSTIRYLCSHSDSLASDEMLKAPLDGILVGVDRISAIVEEFRK